MNNKKNNINDNVDVFVVLEIFRIALIVPLNRRYKKLVYVYFTAGIFLSGSMGAF
jgi:hypothetical protein